MPDSSSNFTNPDAGGDITGGVQGGATTGTGDNGEVWNPTGGPNGTGAWEKPSQHTAQRTFQQGSWGDQGMALDGNGNPIPGTNGADQDAARYRLMGQTPQYTSGPQIDRSRSDETRDISMGALGLLGQTAAGTSPSVAEQLGTKMAKDAGAAQFSMGASVRGGAGARAAASRNAAFGAATIDAQQRQANAATRAGEMANARGAYLNAATGQRGEDLGLATSQAGLDVGQRAANDAREANYEQMGFATKGAELSHQLGRSASDEAASNAAFSTGLQRDAASQDRVNRNVGVGLAGAQGGIAAYGAANQDDGSGTTTKPNSDDNFNSDERTKTKVSPVGTPRPMSDEDAAKVSAKADGVLAGRDLQLESSVGAGTVASRVKARTSRMSSPYDGYDRSMFAKTDDGTAPNTSALHAAIEKQIEDDKPAGNIVRKDPYAPQSMFGANMGETAERGYAKSRRGQPGYILGTGPEASYKDRLWGPGEKDASTGLALGTDDFNSTHDSKWRVPVDDSWKHQKLTMLSDERAKQEVFDKAYDMGRADATASHGEHLSGAHRMTGEQEQEPAKLVIENHGGISDVATAQHPRGPEPKPRVAPVNVDAGKSIENLFGTASERPDARAREHLDKAALAKAIDDAPGRLSGDYRPPPGPRTAVKQPDGGLQLPTFGRDASAMATRNSLGGRGGVGGWLTRQHSLGTPLDDAGKRFLGKPTSVDVARNAQSDESEALQRQVDAVRNVQAQSELKDLRGRLGAQGLDPTLSDERAKTNVHGDGPMASANRSMVASEYEYKPQFAAQNGQRVGEKNVGPMAQNMAADPVARHAIEKDRETGLLAINIPKAVKQTMGGLASLQMEVDELKKRKKAKA